MHSLARRQPSINNCHGDRGPMCAWSTFSSSVFQAILFFQRRQKTILCQKSNWLAECMGKWWRPSIGVVRVPMPLVDPSFGQTWGHLSGGPFQFKQSQFRVSSISLNRFLLHQNSTMTFRFSFSRWFCVSHFQILDGMTTSHTPGETF